MVKNTTWLATLIGLLSLCSIAVAEPWDESGYGDGGPPPQAGWGGGPPYWSPGTGVHGGYWNQGYGGPPTWTGRGCDDHGGRYGATRFHDDDDDDWGGFRDDDWDDEGRRYYRRPCVQHDYGPRPYWGGVHFRW